jgi:hypothetical protein
MGKSNEVVELLKNIKVENLVLDEIAYPSKWNRARSMIQSGYIKFLSLSGQKYDFEPGEYLEIDRGKGILKGLSIDEDGIDFVFTGEVHGLKANSRISPINLMPSKMEWLQANRGLQLLFGTTLAAIGLIISAIRLETHNSSSL